MAAEQLLRRPGLLALALLLAAAAGEFVFPYENSYAKFPEFFVEAKE